MSKKPGWFIGLRLRSCWDPVKNLHQKSRQVNNYSKALLYGLSGCSPPIFTKRSSWIFLTIFIHIINKDFNHSSELPNNLKDESLTAVEINLSIFLSGTRRNLEQINMEERNNIKREIGKRRPNWLILSKSITRQESRRTLEAAGYPTIHSES